MSNSNMALEKFWMIYVEGKASPTRRHEVFEEAHEEAKRLCQKENANTYILSAIRRYETCAPVWVVLAE